MENAELQKNILATVTYYDCLDYPLTSFEIWKYLFKISNPKSQISNAKEKYSLLDVMKELEDGKLKKFISESRGFYFLKNRDNLVEQRIERNKISERKYRTLLFVAKWLRFVPYVRMVAVTGRMAMKNAEHKSDLDLLIVLKHGRIFTGRLLVTGLVHLLGKRRYRNKIADRICLNYFITTQSLEISHKDIFSSSEYFFMLPIFGFQLFHKFQLKNGWIKNYKENFELEDIPNLKMVKDTYFSKFVRKIGEKILDFYIAERQMKNWQVRRIMNDPRTSQMGSMIMADDEMLVFWPDPQSPKVFDKFQGRLEELKV